MSYITTDIDTHASWSAEEWERRALDLEHAMTVLPTNHFKQFRDRFEKHIRHAQELEDGSKCGQAYRAQALETHAQMMFLAKHVEHWTRLDKRVGGVQ